MASDSSFDVVSRVDPQELDNALNQARKEIAGRFDFKHSIASIESDGKTITVLADDELKLRNVIDMIQSKAVKRGIDLRAFDLSKEPETASGDEHREHDTPAITHGRDASILANRVPPRSSRNIRRARGRRNREPRGRNAGRG